MTGGNRLQNLGLAWHLAEERHEAACRAAQSASAEQSRRHDELMAAATELAELVPTGKSVIVYGVVLTRTTNDAKSSWPFTFSQLHDGDKP